MSPLTICLIICALTVASYVWGKISMASTALLSMVLFVVTKCVTPAQAAGNFGNANAIMLVSMFVVAAGFNRTQFVKKIASSVNKLAHGSLTRVMFAYVLVTMLLAQFIRSSMVAYGIVVPMMIATCREMDIHPAKMAFPVGLVAITCCAVLPIGAGATQFAELNGYLESTGYTTYLVGLTDVMKARLPVLISMCLYAIFLGPRFAPSKPVVTTGEIQTKQDTRAPLAPFPEVCGYVLMIATILGLFFQAQLGLPTWVITLCGAVLMVATGVLKPKEAIDSIPWWIAFVYVGALTMGNALAATGAGTVVGGFLSNIAGSIGNKYLIGLVFFLIPFLLTQVMMNNAVITIFIPIAALACQAMNCNPVGLILLVQCGSLSSFMSPMATPTVPMSMALGGYDLKSVLKQSLIPALICCVVSVGWIMTVFPLY